mmetsp:Transcript_138065/g.441050  ORF Transcript_138065/g.441050 Transcript_138065/m.441050 type:complete len:211 (+) Transcript_138065:172-804(+)
MRHPSPCLSSCCPSAAAADAAAPRLRQRQQQRRSSRHTAATTTDPAGDGGCPSVRHTGSTPTARGDLGTSMQKAHTARPPGASILASMARSRAVSAICSAPSSRSCSRKGQLGGSCGTTSKPRPALRSSATQACNSGAAAGSKGESRSLIFRVSTAISASLAELINGSTRSPRAHAKCAQPPTSNLREASFHTGGEPKRSIAQGLTSVAS